MTDGKKDILMKRNSNFCDSLHMKRKKLPQRLTDLQKLQMVHIGLSLSAAVLATATIILEHTYKKREEERAKAQEELEEDDEVCEEK